MNLKDFTPAKDLEEKGVWLPFADAEFLVASSNSDRFTKALRKRFNMMPAPHRDMPKYTDPVTIEEMSKHLLLGWKGEVKNGDTDLPFTPENSLLLCQNKAFRDWLTIETNRLSNYQEENEAADLAALKSES